MRPLSRHDWICAAGLRSVMAWVPRFHPGLALAPDAAALTPSGTVGDWIAPARVPARGARIVPMGGFYADLHLCSAADAAPGRRGRAAPYVSRAGVPPLVDIPIAAFRDGLRARFASGGFDGAPVRGRGGLMPDALWHEIWTLARLSGAPFHGNTDHGRCWRAPEQRGATDPAAPPGTLTGSGPPDWWLPLDDFTGNRAEFTDGLRLRNGLIETAGRRVDPAEDDYEETRLRLAGVAPGQSVAAYRTEEALIPHGLGAAGAPAGGGGFEGQGLYHTDEGLRVADRGSGWGLRALAPGKLSLGKGPDRTGDRVGGRGVFVPDDPAHRPAGVSA